MIAELVFLSDKVLNKDSITNWISYNKWINASIDLERAKSKQFLLRLELRFSQKAGSTSKKDVSGLLGVSFEVLYVYRAQQH